MRVATAPKWMRYGQECELILDVREGPPTRESEMFDVCIVGAGAAGIAMALRLIDSGLRVVMLESGGETFDNQTQIVPNSKIWGDVLRNVTAQTIRRVDLSLELAHGTKVEHAEQVLFEVIREHPKVLDAPEPIVRLHDIGLESLTFIARPWTKREDYWEVRWDLIRAIKLRLDAAGIDFARPQVRVIASNEASP